MRALSLTPPWTEAILSLGKRVENRQAWKGCSYRGPILLHAAKSTGTQDAFEGAVDFILDAVKPEPGPARLEVVRTLGAEMRVGGRGRHHADGWWAPREDLMRGAIVGRCRVVDVIRAGDDVGAIDRGFPGQIKWWMGGFALVLADVERIAEPIPYKGALGFFEVPDALLVGARWEPAG